MLGSHYGPPVAGLATLNKLFLFTLKESPVPALHNVQLFLSSLSPICPPHTHTFWWLLLKTICYMAGPPLSDILNPLGTRGQVCG